MATLLGRRLMVTPGLLRPKINQIPHRQFGSEIDDMIASAFKGLAIISVVGIGGTLFFGGSLLYNSHQNSDIKTQRKRIEQLELELATKTTGKSVFVVPVENLG
jgi:hypothetical protein